MRAPETAGRKDARDSTRAKGLIYTKFRVLTFLNDMFYFFLQTFSRDDIFVNDKVF